VFVTLKYKVSTHGFPPGIPVSSTGKTCKKISSDQWANVGIEKGGLRLDENVGCANVTNGGGKMEKPD
jgi:hypothetical protein